VLPGSSKGTASPRYEEEEPLEEAGEEEEEEEEEAAVPAPAPIPTRASASTKRLPAKKALAPSTAKKGRKKMPAAAAAAGGGRRRHPRTETYRRYIFKVLKQVHPDYGISSKAMDVMHNFVVDQFDKIVEEAARLCKKDKKKTLTAVDIQTAVRLVLPGALGDHAIAEGKKAVLRISGARM
jgi:histone H2B